MPKNNRRSKKVEEVVEESSSSESENEEEEQSDSGSESDSGESGSESSGSESGSESEEEEKPQRRRHESESSANSTNALKSMALQHAMNKSSPSSTVARNNLAAVAQAKAAMPHPQNLIQPSAAPAVLTLQQTSAAPATLQQPSAAPAALTDMQQPSAAPATLQQNSATPDTLQQPSAAPACHSASQSASAASARTVKNMSSSSYGYSSSSYASGSSNDAEYAGMMKASILQSVEANGTRTVAENKRLLTALRHKVDRGVIVFPDVQVPFLGSYHSLDHGKNVKTLREVAGNALNHPKVLDHELVAAVKQHYHHMKEGMIFKVVLKGFSNQTSKDILLLSENEELNGHVAIVKGDSTVRGMFILQAGETKTLDTPVCIVDHSKALENENHHEGLVVKKMSFRNMYKKQVITSPDDNITKCRVLIPSDLLDKKDIAGHLKRELANSDKATTFKHISLLAYIIVTGQKQGKWIGEGKGKINLSKLDIVKVDKKRYVRVPRSIIDEAGIEYEANEEKQQNVASVRLDHVKLKIEPVHTMKFTDIEDTTFQWEYKYDTHTENESHSLFGTKDADVITKKINDLSQGLKANLIRDIGQTRKVTAILNISVIPSLAALDGENGGDDGSSASQASAKVL